MLCILTFANISSELIFPLLYKVVHSLQPITISFWIVTSELCIIHCISEFSKKHSFEGQKKKFQANGRSQLQRPVNPRQDLIDPALGNSAKMRPLLHKRQTHTRCYCENRDLAMPRFPSAKTEFVLWIVAVLVAASGRSLSCVSPIPKCAIDTPHSHPFLHICIHGSEHPKFPNAQFTSAVSPLHKNSCTRKGRFSLFFKLP